MKRLILPLVLAFAFTGCALKPETVSAIKDTIAANKGHMTASDTPPGAKAVATVNHDFLWDVLFREGEVEKLPDAVRARKDARDAKKAAAKAKEEAQ